MGKKSITKGSSFERQIARDLSLWIDPNDKYIFARRAGSGGAFRDKKGFTGSGGDIFSDKPQGKWLDSLVVIELKFYADLLSNFWGFFGTKGKIIQDFISQAREASNPYPDRGWLLIMKCNRYEALFITNCKNFSVVKNAFTVTPNSAGETLYVGAFKNLILTPYINIKQNRT